MIILFQDAMYVLTNDDKITKFVVSELLDDEIPDSSLTRVTYLACQQSFACIDEIIYFRS